MASFQPIEDAGPRLAFGVDDFLRVFVTAASPGVVAGNPSETKTAPGLFQPFKRNSGQGGMMVLRDRFGRKMGSRKFF